MTMQPSAPSFPRRSLLQIGALGMTGICLPAWLEGTANGKSAPRAKACILLYMDGGPSHIDLLDMKPLAPLDVRGPFQPVASTVHGLPICEHMPCLAQRMHLLSLVRSLTHDQTVHDPAVYQMLTGYKHISSAGGLEVAANDVPQMGSALLRVDRARAVMPKVIQIPETMKMGERILPGQNGGFLGPSYDPLRIDVTDQAQVQAPDFNLAGGVALQRLERRRTLLKTFQEQVARLEQTAEVQRFDRFQQQAIDILRDQAVSDAFNLGQESPATRDRYGRHRQGQSTLLARRLVEAGARFVTVYWGHENQDWADGKGPRPANNPWDTHRNHFPLVQNSLVPRADQALAALIDDLAARGLLEDTLVIWMGEFGRTPRINSQWASRDHWPYAFSIIMAGAGIRSGAVLGVTDKHAAFVTSDPVTPADLTATIFASLGIDPRATVPNLDGQPHPISTGKPVAKLFT